MRAGWRRAGLLVLAVSLAFEAPAGSAPPREGQQPTFRASVDLVTVDVIPRDGRGQFISDLTPRDFIVLEDGVSQNVGSVVLVHGGRVFNLQAPPAPPAAEGVLLPASSPAGQTAGRVFIIVVDDLHVEAHDTPLLRDLLRKIASTLVHDGDMFAMVSTGPSAVEEPLTYERQRLDAAIGRVSGNGLDPQEIFQAPRDGAQGPADVRRRVHVAFSTAYQLLAGLERVRDRRKAMILVSNGYDFDPYPQARRGQDQVFGGRYGMPTAGDEQSELALALQAQNRFADADLAGELRALATAANRANTSIYAIDPRGVAGFIGADRQLDQAERKAHLRRTQSSLRELAEATGGLAVVNDNDFRSALARIDAETSDYYMLGYYSSNPDASKRTRQIEVRVSRGDVRVWSRTSYTLKPAKP